MDTFKYYVERTYPYVLSAIITIILFLLRTNILVSENLNNALDAIITMASLIIGFLGAVLPVIMGMKNDSKFVKYVFEKDDKKLFLKYIKASLSTGLLLVIITVCLYFSNDLPFTISKIIFFVGIFFLLVFLLCTYRCLKNMLDLIFSEDKNLINPVYRNISENDEKDKDLEKKYGR